ncbi:unnamed protein product [Choristocarpus tenellus]
MTSCGRNGKRKLDEDYFTKLTTVQVVLVEAYILYQNGGGKEVPSQDLMDYVNHAIGGLMSESGVGKIMKRLKFSGRGDSINIPPLTKQRKTWVRRCLIIRQCSPYLPRQFCIIQYAPTRERV